MGNTIQGNGHQHTGSPSEYQERYYNNNNEKSNFFQNNSSPMAPMFVSFMKDEKNGETFSAHSDEQQQPSVTLQGLEIPGPLQNANNTLGKRGKSWEETY